MFKPLVIFGNELLRTDYAGIRKIARTISETIAFVEFKFSATLFFENLILNDMDIIQTLRLFKKENQNKYRIDQEAVYA